MELDDYVEAGLVHEIHTSERRSFRSCRRRWDWISRQRYYPIVTPHYFEFGTAFHVAQEVYYDPSKWSWDREVMAQHAILAFVNTCEDQRAAALKAAPNLYDAAREQDYNDRVELGKGMLKHYFYNIAPNIDRGWIPVKVEIGFKVIIPNPETGEEAIWCACNECFEKWLKHEQIEGPPGTVITTAAQANEWNEDIYRFMFNGLPAVYAGRLDMLAQDPDGHLWIFDWKTAKNVSKDYEFLYLDDQVGSYPWALKKLDLDVKGFIYHEQRKGYPQPPKRNVNRRLGCMYSVARNQDTDYETYLKTVQEEDTEAYKAGCYDEFLKFLQGEGIVYFDRHQIPKSDAELLEIERNIGFETLDMLDPGLRIYPSAGRFSCGFCAYRQPCMEQNAQGDYKYALDTLFQKLDHYYLRNRPSTESKGGE